MRYVECVWMSGWNLIITFCANGSCRVFLTLNFTSNNPSSCSWRCYLCLQFEFLTHHWADRYFAYAFYVWELFVLSLRTFLLHLCYLWRMFQIIEFPFARQIAVHPRWERLFFVDRRFYFQLLKIRQKLIFGLSKEQD